MKYLGEIRNISNIKFISFLFIVVLDILTRISLNLAKKKYGRNENQRININKEFLNIESFENNILFPIQKKLEGFIETSNEEQGFLNGIIRKIKPKKIVEIGVAYGGTSTIILNAIKDIKEAKLISIDINKHVYKNHSLETGFIVNKKFPELSEKWELYTGGLTSEFIEKIGDEIDLVYIDTVHSTPGEMLNWLEILPFLKEEAFVVLHDTFMMYYKERIVRPIINYSNNQILCYIRGDLILPSYNNNTFSRNIGALKLFKNQEKYYLQYFLALGTQWQYLPSERELNILRNFFKLCSLFFNLKLILDGEKVISPKYILPLMS